jgi:leucyl-tRNA synthetase
VKAKILIDVGVAEEHVIHLAKTHIKIAPLLTDFKIIKEIYVPNKLVNFVVGQKL